MTDVDALAREYDEQWPADTHNDTAILARAYLELAKHTEEWELACAEATRKRMDAEARLSAARALVDWPVGRPTSGVDRMIPASELLKVLDDAAQPEAGEGRG